MRVNVPGVSQDNIMYVVFSDNMPRAKKAHTIRIFNQPERGF